MAKLCRIVTAAVFAIHMIVGCCTHHAHACEGHGLSSSAEGAAEGQCPDPDGHACPADHSQHGPHGCQGGKCSTIVQAVSNFYGQPVQSLAMPLLEDRSAPDGVGPDQHFSSSGRLLLPVRLHLANQVLLI